MIDSLPYFITRIAEDSDFMRLKEMSENHEGWSIDYDKHTVKVWTKHTDDCSFNMVKVWAVFSDINCVDLYDTIHDPEYRKQWDSHMLVGFDIGYLNPNNDVSYYSMYCPAPLKNRDLVLQRSWLDNGTEFYIINHSVCHKDYPPKKGFVRAISYFTGYFIRCQGLNREANGCELSYVTRSDPQGDLPSWIVNKCTQILAPRYVKQIEKAASGYAAWKRHNRPHLKPWVYPEQITSPKISVQDCIPSAEDLALNPDLRKFDFKRYFAFLEEAGKENTVTEAFNQESPKKSTKQPKEKKIKMQLDSQHSREGMSCEEHDAKTTLKKSPSNKAKKKLNSLLNITKICRKGSEE